MAHAIEGQLINDDDAAVWPQAKQLSDLPTPQNLSEVVGLGGLEDERFATEMLGNAGISVELLGDFDPDMTRFDFMQVICEEEAQERLTKKPLRLANKVDMLGFVVKLNAELKWRITINEENRSTHHLGRARVGRGAAQIAQSTFMNHQIHEIFVPHSGTMRATVAVSGGVTITVLFQCEDNDTGENAQWRAGMPLIRQRRIDMLFFNQHVASLCTRFIDVIDEQQGDFKLENLSSYGKYPANWNKLVDDKTPLLMGTTLNVAAQVANIAEYDGVDLGNFLNAQFGKVKDYAEHVRKTIGDVHMYLSAPCTNQDGVQVVPDSYEEFLTQYYSGGWDTLCQKWNYDGPAMDEPLFTLIETINKDDFAISATADTFVSQSSMAICDCISAWAMSKTAPSARRAVNGAAAPQIGQSSQKGQGFSETRAFKVPGSSTDTAWKAIWQEVVRRSTADAALMPTEADMTSVLTEFANQIGRNEFQIGAAKAPFVKVFKLTEYSSMSFTDHINAFLNEHGVGPNAPEQGAAGRKRNRTGGGTGSRVARASARFADVDNEVDSEGLEQTLTAAMEQGALVEKLVGDVKKAEQNSRKHADRIADLESFKTFQQQWAKQVDSRLDSAQASAPPAPEDANLKVHLTQMSAIMSQLASIMGQMNVVLGSNMFASQSSYLGSDGTSAAKTFADLICKPSFDGIINSIDNVYRWNKEQKLAFYASVQSIQVFKDKLNELEKE